jgi:hypothetical protein
MVRRINDESGHLYVGTLREMVDHINHLHRKSGIQHAARELGG